MALDPTRLKAAIRARLEAIANFPKVGQSPVFVDDRVLQALCEEIVSEFTGHADVLPLAHSGTSLTDPQGQTGVVTSGLGAGGGVLVQTDQLITGKGSLQ